MSILEIVSLILILNSFVLVCFLSLFHFCPFHLDFEPLDLENLGLVLDVSFASIIDVVIV